MSGLLAMARTAGAITNREEFDQLLPGIACCGTGASGTWHRGPVALGYVRLQTPGDTEVSAPYSRDSHAAVVFDGRLDARDELRAQLDDAADSRSSDADLVLASYGRWGRECAGRLLGDFAFVIWDGRQQELLCVRDQMGVRPLYYALINGALLVSSTIDALLRHRDVRTDLNERSIADFVLFGCNQEPDTTSYTQIRRVPAASALTWRHGGIVVRKYWELPIEEPLYRRRSADYVDEYHATVDTAVRDRCGARVSVFLSGGLDSSGLAASAVKQMGTRSAVRGFTCAFRSIMPDDEERYATAVAQHLGIRCHVYPLDNEPRWVEGAWADTVEPHNQLSDPTPLLACYQEMAAHSPVVFYGEGPDNALQYEWQAHVRHLHQRRDLARLGADVAKHIVTHRRIPSVLTVARALRGSRRAASAGSSFPRWLAPELARRLSLRDRWEAFHASGHDVHPVRPRAYASLRSPQWELLFDTLRPPYTRVPLDVRHPYLDLRVLRFFLRLPAVPWCRRKQIQRASLRSVLPRSIVTRPKTPLAEWPDTARARLYGFPRVVWPSSAERFLDRSSFIGAEEPTPMMLRAVSLGHWLQARERQSVRSRKGTTHVQRHETAIA